MGSIENIIEGWMNVLVKDDEVEKVARERLEICGSCPEAKVSPITQWIAGRENKIEAAICGACGCPLLAKVRSLAEICEHPDGDKWKNK